MSRCMDLLGKQFGYLTVIERAENNSQGRARWLCKCKCGGASVVVASQLTSGKTQSCGCKKLESHNKRHGLTKTDIHNKWVSMRQRCNDKKSGAYKRYGAIGINVCDEWNVFENFYNWSMGNGYKDGLSIDRIDNSKGYSPDNCRWIDWRGQCNNRSSNLSIEYNGKTQTLKEWCDELKLPYNMIQQRISVYGYTFDMAISYARHQHRK